MTILCLLLTCVAQEPNILIEFAIHTGDETGRLSALPDYHFLMLENHQTLISSSETGGSYRTTALRTWEARELLKAATRVFKESCFQQDTPAQKNRVLLGLHGGITYLCLRNPKTNQSCYWYAHYFPDRGWISRFLTKKDRILENHKTKRFEGDPPLRWFLFLRRLQKEGRDTSDLGW